jgi:RNA polymerase sigma-70 factor (ECF subfamily)
MPPLPYVYDGIEQVRPLMEEGLPAAGEWRVVATSANRMPAAACYLREPGGTEFRAFKIDVLRIVDGGVAEVTTFSAKLFDEFGLAATA